MDAALEMIAESGLDELTLSAVARRAGVSRATAYREFGDKDGLVTALTRREIGEMIAAGYQEFDVFAPMPQLARAATLFAIRYLRKHAAFTYIRVHEPAWLLNVAISHDGSEVNLIEMVGALLTPLLSVRRTDALALTPAQAAEVAVRTVLSHVLIERSHLTDEQVADAVARAVGR
ncbi:TetR/AcrR family transcriptional regulator [Nocardia yunnanensis]|uniref:TetR/AcrR family transcriptional regulator n=2 Tax=Nocardia yunnanensis TaxID=2382165 RepID=A0A386ZD97_9NOCA|nr:TetR/AcrR family transcriptional regulator [Nocardia yunnanensis]